MSKIKLTVACGDYDYLRPLRDGRVQPEGIDLNLIHVECGPRHRRMYHHGEFDACEFSMGTYLVAHAQGAGGLQALPFISRRMFVHRFCFVRADRGIQTPDDLRGRRIGVVSYQNSLAIFVKAMLMHDHGIGLGDVTWVTTGAETAATPLPANVRIEQADRPLEALLLAGEVDAIATPDLPRAWLGGDGTLARLFPEHERVERDGYRRTRVFPIMHPLVVKQSILERDPWIAASLYAAFVEAMRLHDAWQQQPHRLSTAWPQAEAERQLFCGSPFAQGLRANRHDLEHMIRLAGEQGLLARPLTADELFASSLRGT